jgi:hypothetical protein
MRGQPGVEAHGDEDRCGDDCGDFECAAHIVIASVASKVPERRDRNSGSELKKQWRVARDWRSWP